MDPINIYEYEAIAQAKLTPMAYDYYASGAHDEITLHENHAAYDRLRLRYRVLRDISRRSTATTVLGHALNMPVIVAPTAFHKLAQPEGEIATVRAAGAAGTLMILSTLSTTSIEDVLAAATGPVWFQLYVYKDREATKGLVQRAEAAGCSALVLTVDAQIWGRRERDVRNRFQLPPGLSVKNLMPAGQEEFPQTMKDSGLAAYVASLFDQTLSWQDVAWLCSLTKLPVLLKGIVHPDDARLAVEHGAAGVIVSNHGGRQLDTAPATIEALPDIVAAVDGRIEVLIDGGIRRGTDVVKALALGARAVAVGRPVLWGLAAGGQRGVERVLELLRFEVDLAMGLCGAANVSEIGRDLLM
ncbi:FMN-dependent alpha-hydroxy acid dehydrogenase [Candidatus Promineifilum breve]|uniref:FMN-dependent alpha-hydroxy acid dehydrogenase n=1 Tax=Candidatus Promineifilum breve TaxID=1806508 RepID=A0A160T343_9CHLR|nr:alpha-hydroxy acid oxidase [Candidatus Promineifilum breve]CUS03719.2 FMN-dependent alpha-hydroxy acid dehydrogenase [Candidatus Promineifilum breve]